MTGKKLPSGDERNAWFGRVVERCIWARLYRSPEMFARSFAPQASPIGERDLRKIVDGEALLTEAKFDLLDAMLRFPAGTMQAVIDCDVAALRDLGEFPDVGRSDGERIRELLIREAEQVTNPPRGRRSDDQKRITG